ncbi:hypothetical protein [Mycobacteroides immunogenum]|uniref:Mammalian cell entry protein n=1 Tax=Mycobacteroides immunogenum TaxID=83262 RepID=A0A7V8RVH4_9MYCO|nr:hypothetical protein [Mycobacteroides immunogenum]AMT72623.1 hypothetical protein ABG82_22500 [Mycobacteroides immunogenum]ANO05787.1 hypothetical protein BAB75_22780 [Mycobacteroides immunogenum]KIU41056.1 hypothetical protein TL11_08280 [Mycobacteroides immunogenum]KPG05963.1 hypothetical protein AN909_19590 [Mycobacteroides immunogenum]KPG07611.1 hypothetical protein AN908_19070 [Mycobacteroides immunogenum]
MSTTAAEDNKLLVDDDSAEDDAEDRASGEQGAEDRETVVTQTESAVRQERRISLSVRGLALGAIITALVVALAAMSWMYVGADRDLDTQAQQARDSEHAEQVALDYAVRAAIMSYKDLAPWKRALVEGTTPELTKKLTDAANAMEQLLLPLQWTSTAKPIAARVRSHEKGVYIVDSFVSVRTKTVQAPDNLQSTATYAVTIDPANDWKITDVGGIGQVVGDK